MMSSARMLRRAKHMERERSSSERSRHAAVQMLWTSLLTVSGAACAICMGGRAPQTTLVMQTVD